jgi:DNA helicase-2/ATP-dependent DNA helicase PcrA
MSETHGTSGIRLTDEQRALVSHADQGGPALCVAVAGAGKTTAICATVQRIVDLGVDPQDVLVATFSAHGADDMRARAARLGIHAGVNWRTLHSCGWSIVGEVSSLGKETPDRRDPVVVDPRSGLGWWVKKLLRNYLRERAAQVSGDEQKDAIKKSGPRVISEVSLASAHLIWPEAWTAADGVVFPEYVTWATTRDREPADAVLADLTDGFFRLWESVKGEPELADYKPPTGDDRRGAGALHPRRRPERRALRAKVKWFSFDDQIAWPARWILEGKKFVAQFRGAFRWVIVDEAQDNNLAQTVLAKHLTQDDNLIFVGDDQQSIYAFRGSKPALLRAFRDERAIKQIEFTANFRCAAAILDVGNGILGHATDRLYQGDLRVGRTDALAPGGTVTATEYHDGAAEAAGVLDGIQAAIAQGVNPDDIAVLYRLNSQSGALELECIKRGVLYEVAGGKFFNRAEIKTVIAFLTVAQDEQDEDAWKRVTSSVVRGLGAGFVRDYPTLAAARGAASKRGLLSGWKKALGAVLPVIDQVKVLLAGGDLRGAIEHIANEGGVRKHYRDDAAGEDDETDVDVALNGLAECAETIGTVDALLRFARSSTGKGDEDGGREPRVNLSTVHKAKGLEWTYVAAIGWTKGVFPFVKAPIEEERRLGYVCATRARQFLHVSWTAVDSYGNEAGPSRLVTEGKVEEVVSRYPATGDATPGALALPPGALRPATGTPDWGRAIGQ